MRSVAQITVPADPHRPEQLRDRAAVGRGLHRQVAEPRPLPGLGREQPLVDLLAEDRADRAADRPADRAADRGQDQGRHLLRFRRRRDDAVVGNARPTAPARAPARAVPPPAAGRRRHGDSRRRSGCTMWNCAGPARRRSTSPAPPLRRHEADEPQARIRRSTAARSAGRAAHSRRRTRARIDSAGHRRHSDAVQSRARPTAPAAGSGRRPAPAPARRSAQRAGSSAPAPRVRAPAAGASAGPASS